MLKFEFTGLSLDAQSTMKIDGLFGFPQTKIRLWPLWKEIYAINIFESVCLQGKKYVA